MTKREKNILNKKPNELKVSPELDEFAHRLAEIFIMQIEEERAKKKANKKCQ